jgi:cytochrome P450
VNNSKSFGPDHESFNPERFLDKEGLALNSLQKNFAPFSLGKRNCIGEQLAQIESFLFIAAILQKYRVSNPPEKPLPSLDLNIGITTKPYPFEMVLTKRNKV